MSGPHDGAFVVGVGAVDKPRMYYYVVDAAFVVVDDVGYVAADNYNYYYAVDVDTHMYCYLIGTDCFEWEWETWEVMIDCSLCYGPLVCLLS